MQPVMLPCPCTVALKELRCHAMPLPLLLPSIALGSKEGGKGRQYNLVIRFPFLYFPLYIYVGPHPITFPSTNLLYSCFSHFIQSSPKTHVYAVLHMARERGVMDNIREHIRMCLALLNNHVILLFIPFIFFLFHF